MNKILKKTQKELNGNFGLEKCNNQNKKHTWKLDSNMEMTPYTWRLINHDNEKKKFFKWTEPLEPGWYTKTGNIYVIRVLKEQKKAWCRKNIWGNKCWKLPILSERHKPTNSRRSTHHNSIDTNESTSRHIIIKLLKTKDKENTLRAVRGKWLITYRRRMSWMMSRSGWQIQLFQNSNFHLKALILSLATNIISCFLAIILQNPVSRGSSPVTHTYT